MVKLRERKDKKDKKNKDSEEDNQAEQKKDSTIDDPDYDPEKDNENCDDESEEDKSDDVEEEDDEGESEEDDDDEGEEESEDDMMEQPLVIIIPPGYGKRKKIFKYENDTDEYNDEEEDGHEEGEEDELKNEIKECCNNKKAKKSLIPIYTKEETSYWKTLSENEQKLMKNIYDSVINSKANNKVPLRFRIINSDMEQGTKLVLLTKLNQFQRMSESSSEYSKMRNLLENVASLPLGKYKEMKVKATDEQDQIANFLVSIKDQLNKTVYGHEDAKDQIIRVLAKWIANPNSKGNCIGIQGAMGTGKTSLVKEGISKAIELPFGFVALGGATDASFLEGHSYTYEGSTHGRIAEMLIKAQCMNPILYFDELDKISDTRKGEEIVNVLTHLTDTSQNDKYTDKYFGDIELDLSKCLMIFSYNDESKINPILKDRMVTIHVKGYSTKEKLKIASGYLIPEILKQYNIKNDDLIFSEDIITKIINKVDSEEGVRNLKRGLDAIISWINMIRFTEKDTIVFPITINEDHIDKYIKKNTIDNISLPMMYL